jgi:dUTP pyrophosphatase
MTIKFKKLSPNAKLPTYAHPGDGGMDVYTSESYSLKPGETHAFSTGIASEFPIGYVALVWDKGGLGAQGIHRFSGVIDAGYRGEWFVTLHNATAKEYNFEKGDKIAQVLIQNIVYANVEETDTLSSSERGVGKMGSTGRK